MLEHTEQEAQDALVEEATRLRDAGALGRSDQLVRLFDFLLTCSLAGRSPKEVEIASEVFRRDGSLYGDDSQVRVYMHRLRQKLAAHYAGHLGQRLTVPLGGYRLVLSAEDEPAPPLLPPVVSDPATATEAGWQFRRSRFLLAGLAILLVGMAALGYSLFLYMARPSPHSAMSTLFWGQLASNEPIYLVCGDTYLFEETTPEGSGRLVSDPSINSREDLDQYLLSNPKDKGRLFDADARYYPVGTLDAAQKLLARNVLSNATGAVSIIPSSHFKPEMLHGSNIVYVGMLNGLGLLGAPLSQVSKFSFLSEGRILDRVSGKTFDPGLSRQGDRIRPIREYAYVASFPGPTGARILIVAGTRDAALAQAVDVTLDSPQIHRILQKANSTGAFEALVEVSSLYSANLGGAVVAEHGLATTGLWAPGVLSKPANQQP